VQYEGGAIYTLRCTPTLTNIRINTNATGNAIANAYTSAGTHGGAIFLNETNGMTVHDIITNNTASKGGQGGSMYLRNRSGTATVTKIKITTARAESSATLTGTGGAILIANYLGGIFKLGADGAGLNDPDIIIDDAEAEEHWGGIWVHNEGGLTGSVTLNRISTNNTRGLLGYSSIGFYMPDGGYSYISNSTISNAVSNPVIEKHSQAALYFHDKSIDKPAYTSISNVKIKDVQGKHGAGVMINQDRREANLYPNEPPAPYHIVVIDSLTVENATSLYWPALGTTSGPAYSIKMSNSQFTNCTATNGGNIFTVTTTTTADISSCTVSDSPGVNVRTLNNNWTY
jgi:hypothetical protein